MMSLGDCAPHGCTLSDGCRNCKDDEVRNVNGVHAPTLQSREWEDFNEAPMDIGSKKFNFSATGIVQEPWRIVKTVECPKGFLMAGGDACVIQEGKGYQKRVLLALPDWAVDLRRAKWMARATGSSQMPSGSRCSMCRFYHAKAVGDNVVLEFDFPAGKPITWFLEERGALSEAVGKQLCCDLLTCILGHHESTLRLWGFIDASTVFLDSHGFARCLLPLGNLLSIRGVKAVCMALSERAKDTSNTAAACYHIPPELYLALHDGIYGVHTLDEHSVGTDSYGVIALIAEAMSWGERDRPRQAGHPRVASHLSAAAKDCLNKALYEDPAWRLCGKDLLVHQWMTTLKRRGTGGTQEFY